MQNNTLTLCVYSIIKQTVEPLYNVIIHLLYNTTVYTLWLNVAEKNFALNVTLYIDFMSDHSMRNLLVINKLEVSFRQIIV